jgi:hypothetical protein
MRKRISRSRRDARLRDPPDAPPDAPLLEAPLPDALFPTPHFPTPLFLTPSSRVLIFVHVFACIRDRRAPAHSPGLAVFRGVRLRAAPLEGRRHLRGGTRGVSGGGVGSAGRRRRRRRRRGEGC